MNLFICTSHPLGEKKRGVSDQIINVMRLIVVLTILCCFKVSASVYAQKISIDVDNVPIETVFDQIKKQSGYTFWYKDNVLEAAKRVTVKLKDFELKAALEACLKDQPLRYEISGKIIVIRPKVVVKKVLPGLKAMEIKGKVLDEKGLGLAGVTVRLKGTDKRVVTGDGGEFVIEVPDVGSVLVFSFVGYEGLEYVVRDGAAVSVALRLGTAQLQEVGIVNTGYQALPKERATGSFVQIDNELLNRRVSTNILERLDGISPGVFFNGAGTKSINIYGTDFRNSGINIRGQSTLQGNVDPLIVVDNFPYEGEISNINPNDIESITILKDAAAASIWGASAGNGVIVITTKKGKLEQKMKVDFTSNFTIGNRPNLAYDRNFLRSSDYIDVETYLFNNGYFDDDLNNTISFPAVSPVVHILSQKKAGLLTGVDADAQINALRDVDVRDDFENYIYRKSFNQQYSLSLRGGTKNLAYSFSAGQDNNEESLRRNGLSRTTVASHSTFSPVKNLELSAGINYSSNITRLNNNFQFGALGPFDSGSFYRGIYPYAKLADGNGNALPVMKDYSTQYINTMEQMGFKDWHYRPLDEINLADNTVKLNDLLLKFSAAYKIVSGLAAEIQFQKEHQNILTRNFQSPETYVARNLVNQFSQIDGSNNSINYIFPQGGILDAGSYDWNATNVRGQLNYNRVFNKHDLSGIVGAEIRERQTEGFDRKTYGYNEEYGSGNGSLNYNTAYPTNPGGVGYIPAPPSHVNGITYRYVSYFATAGYTYDDKYTFNLSGRKDGANIFGVNANDRITPLWSFGFGWNIAKEEFYNFSWLPVLRLRASYGFNGNVYSGSAYLTGNLSNSPITGANGLAINKAPNPDLRWERVKNINFGLDFGTLNSRVTGTIEVFKKDGKDLLQPTPLAPQTGFRTYLANTASTTSHGFDITLQTKNLQREFKWNTTLLVSTIKDKVVRFDVPQTYFSIQNNRGISGIPGKSMYGLFSYKWMGLDPTNGDPQGFMGGKLSKDYTGIINNYSPDSLIYSGSARPTFFGSIRNDFQFSSITLSVNIGYKLGYVFRRSSISTNYTGTLAYYANVDYINGWKKPGDEMTTNIPSMVYPDDSRRNDFFTYSEALIESGSHVRLQDIKVAYDLPIKKWMRGNIINRFQTYLYANNIGILWRENKHGIDPDAFGWGATHILPNPFSISFGINVNF